MPRVPSDLDLEFALHLRDNPALNDRERAVCTLITLAVTTDEALDDHVMDDFEAVIRHHAST